MKMKWYTLVRPTQSHEEDDAVGEGALEDAGEGGGRGVLWMDFASFARVHRGLASRAECLGLADCVTAMERASKRAAAVAGAVLVLVVASRDPERRLRIGVLDD